MSERKKVKAVQVNSDSADYGHGLNKSWARFDCRGFRCERKRVRGTLADAAKQVEGMGTAVENDEV